MAVAHGVNDAYVGFLAPLLPRIMDKLGLSIALAATLAMILSIATSLMQPGLGYLADRFGRRSFAIIGPVVTGVFLSMIGLAPTFGTLVVLLVLGGLGSAAFHPPGASMATRAAEGKGSGMRLSIFSFGGAAGYAMGPLMAVGVVGWLGLPGLWVAMIPGVLLGVLLWNVLPAGAADHSPSPPPHPLVVLRHLMGPLGLLFGVSALAAFVQRVYLTLMPIIIAEQGGSEGLGAVALTVYLGAQALGTLTGGILTDRWDRRRLLVMATFLAFPTHAAAVLLPAGSVGGLAFAAGAGFLNMMLLPPIVVMAQEILPEGAAVGAGVVMGLAWAVGSVLVLGTGVLADYQGPVFAAAVSMPLILLGTLLAAHPALRPYGRAQA